jgi:hypothetical protein
MKAERMSTENSLIAYRDNVEDFVENMLTLEKPFILPREVPTPVAPHLFGYSVKVSPPAGVTRGAMIVRPSPDAFLDFAEVEDQSATPLLIAQSSEFSFAPVAGELTLDQTLILPAGHVKCSTATSGITGYHLSNSTYSEKLGLKYYPGNWTFSANDIILTVYNPNSQAFTVTFDGGVVQTNGNAVNSFNSGATVCNAKAMTNITVAAATAGWVTLRTLAADPAQSKGFWFGLTITANLPSRMSAGFQMSVSGPTITGADQIIWNRKTLWDVLGARGAVAKQQFDSAARHCVTGMNCIFSNVSNKFANAGSIYACRFPGDTFEQLPGSLDDLIALISSQVHHKLETYTLEFGASYAHTPEKVQDWFFQEKVEEDPYNGNPLNLPYMVLVWDASVADAALPVFNVHGRIMLEYLTTDISNVFFMAPVDPGLRELLICELSQYNTLAENPDHLKKFAEVAKRVATSDTAKKFYRTAINAGVKLAPLILSMLV